MITTLVQMPKLIPKRDRRMRPRLSPAAVAQRAYELYERRGGEHGHDWEDWFQAERELLAARHSTAA